MTAVGDVDGEVVGEEEVGAVDGAVVGAAVAWHVQVSLTVAVKKVAQAQAGLHSCPGSALQLNLFPSFPP